MDKINFTERLKSLLLFPGYEWKIISLEKRPLKDDFNQFTFRWVLFGALALFIGSFFYVRNDLRIDAYRFSFPLVQAGFYVIMQTILLFATSIVVNRLAPRFGSVRHFRSSARLVFYSSTPLLMMFILINLNHALIFLAVIPGFYSYYLFWVGLPVLLKTREPKRIAFVAIYMIFTMGAFTLLSKVFGLVSEIVFPGSIIAMGR